MYGHSLLAWPLTEQEAAVHTVWGVWSYQAVLSTL
jgi:hypothetical protein